MPLNEKAVEEIKRMLGLNDLPPEAVAIIDLMEDTLREHVDDPRDEKLKVVMDLLNRFTADFFVAAAAVENIADLVLPDKDHDDDEMSRYFKDFLLDAVQKYGPLDTLKALSAIYITLIEASRHTAKLVYEDLFDGAGDIDPAKVKKNEDLHEMFKNMYGME